jgi:hypothetical protein
MKTFTDAAGREWKLTIDVNAMRRVRDAIKVDLMEVVTGDLTDRLAADPVLLVDVLFVLVKAQADAASPKVSDEEFGKTVIGDVIDQATSALLEELADFFPKARGKMLRMAIAKGKELQTMAQKASSDLLASGQLEKTLEALIQKRQKNLLQNLAGSLSIGLPGSPDSTPAPSPSGS